MPELIVKLGDNIVQKYFFVRESMRVGRAPDNEIVIENLAVSRNHSMIAYEDGRYVLSDLGSSNGTFVNGVRVNKTEIMDKDVIAIGKHKLYFYDQRNGEQPARAQALDADRTMMVSIQSVEQSPLPAELIVTKGRQKGQVFVLGATKTSIGRGAGNDVRLNDWFISKHHAEIERRGSEYHIVDLDSWRHTMVNGAAIDAARLEDGDEVQLGSSVVLTFKVAQPARENAVAARHPVELEVSGASRPSPASAAAGSALHEDDEQVVPTTVLPMDAVFGPPSHGSHGTSEDSAAALASAADKIEQVWSTVSPKTEEKVAQPDEEPWEEPPAPNVAAHLAPPQPAPAPAPAPDEGSEHYLLAGGTRQDGEDAVESLVENLARASVRGAVECAAEAHATIESRAAAGTPERETREDRPPANGSGPGAAEAPAGNGAAPAASQAVSDEVRMWERALTNKSVVIRKQAARRLKRITGRDYEF